MYAGIDFGTSNSTVVGGSEQGSVESFDIDPLFHPPTILRSAIYFPSFRGRRPLVGGKRISNIGEISRRRESRWAALCDP